MGCRCHRHRPATATATAAAAATATTAAATHHRHHRLHHHGRRPRPSRPLQRAVLKSGRTPPARRCRPTCRTRSCTSRPSCGCSIPIFLLRSISPQFLQVRRVDPVAAATSACSDGHQPSHHHHLHLTTATSAACRASFATRSPPRTCRAWCGPSSCASSSSCRGRAPHLPPAAALRGTASECADGAGLRSVGTVTGFFLKYLDPAPEGGGGRRRGRPRRCSSTLIEPTTRAHLPASHHSPLPLRCSRGRSSAHRWTRSRCWRR